MSLLLLLLPFSSSLLEASGVVVPLHLDDLRRRKEGRDLVFFLDSFAGVVVVVEVERVSAGVAVQVGGRRSHCCSSFVVPPRFGSLVDFHGAVGVVFCRETLHASGKGAPRFEAKAKDDSARTQFILRESFSKKMRPSSSSSSLSLKEKRKIDQPREKTLARQKERFDALQSAQPPFL